MGRKENSEVAAIICAIDLEVINSYSGRVPVGNHPKTEALLVTAETSKLYCRILVFKSIGFPNRKFCI